MRVVSVLILIFTCLCVDLSVGLRATHMQFPQRPEGGVGSPRNGVREDCEPPCVCSTSLESSVGTARASH